MAMREDGGSWWRLALSRSVVRRALRVTVVVGGVLLVVNHGDALVEGRVTASRVLQMVVTVFVPYAVSTYSSVGMILDGRKSTVDDQHRAASSS